LRNRLQFLAVDAVIKARAGWRRFGRTTEQCDCFAAFRPTQGDPMNLRSIALFALLSTPFGCAFAADPAALETAADPGALKPGALDLTQPADNLTALVKMRCSLDDKENVFTWWKGTIFAHLPEKAPQAILGFEGYNVCRMVRQDDGTWQFLSRELSFYRDLASGEIIDVWRNPFTDADNQVVQVANDPVNHVFSAKTRSGGPNLYPWESKGGDLMLTFNVPLTYPNPLSPEAFPKESSGPMYVGSEHFMFFTPLAQINDPSIRNASASYGWTRVGPWLPWMKMGTAPGTLLYIAQGHKIDSLGELPADMQARIAKDYPIYAQAPDAWTAPNATSWNVYKALMQEPDQAGAPAGAADATPER